VNPWLNRLRFALFCDYFAWSRFTPKKVQKNLLTRRQGSVIGFRNQVEECKDLEHLMTLFQGGTAHPRTRAIVRGVSLPNLILAGPRCGKAFLASGIWPGGLKRNSADMHGNTGIGQDSLKHKERREGFCPRWFALAASGRNSTNLRSHFAQVLQNVCAFAPLRLCVERSICPTSRPARRPMELCRQHPGRGIRNNSK
jgi:hypothetical protein